MKLTNNQTHHPILISLFMIKPLLAYTISKLKLYTLLMIKVHMF